MTKPEVILKPQAREDIKQIAYIKEDSPQSSMAFRHTIENIYELLLELPEIGTAHNFPNPEMKGLRMLPVRKWRAGSSVFISLRQLTALAEATAKITRAGLGGRARRG